MGILSWIVFGLIVGMLAKFVMPGNDDPWSCDTVIEAARHVQACDDRIVSVGGHEMVSCGYSNPTPWHTPRELDEDALYRLELGAAGYRRMLPRQDVEELVNETLRRALEGCRKWPKDVPFMAFLFESMRSIAWEFLKRNRREVPDS